MGSQGRVHCNHNCNPVRQIVSMGYTAAVCAANGHLVSFRVADAAKRIEVRDNGIYSKVRPYCEICGAPVITACPAGCGLAIPNPRGLDGVRPFCGGCGQPFGWATLTERFENLYVKLAYPRNHRQRPFAAQGRNRSPRSGRSARRGEARREAFGSAQGREGFGGCLV